MKLRFVTCSDELSALIRAREGAVASWLKFVPSHVEMVVKEGFLGAHDEGGVQIRRVGYDAATLSGELFLDVPLTADGNAAAEKFARARLGAPYDWEAIIDFVAPVALHEAKHYICSALMTLTVVAGKAFPGPLAKPAHAVSPLDLLFLFSGRQGIGGS
jgi:hypothetical protein